MSDLTDPAILPPARGVLLLNQGCMSASSAQLTADTPRLRHLNLGEWSWALFECARNPYYILIVIYIFGPYFSATVVGDPIQGQALWGYINGFAGFTIAIFAPSLGAIADHVGRRKPWILVMVALMIPSILLLWFAVPGAEPPASLILLGFEIPALGSPSVMIATLGLTLAGLGFVFSEVFHNAMLPTASPQRMGATSGLGLALGNAGAVFTLLVILLAFAFPADPNINWSWLPDAPLLGLDADAWEHLRIASPIAAIWLLLFCAPLFLFTPDGHGISRSGVLSTLKRGVTDVVATLREITRPHYRNIGIYLLARMFFNDGKVAIMVFSGVYVAGVFGWGGVELILFGIILSIVGVFGGILGGWMDTSIGSRRALLIAISINCLALLIAISITPTSILFMDFDGLEAKLWALPYFDTLPELLYLLVSFLFAIFITSAYANSRTLLARIAPPEAITKFFGLYGLSGQATAFLAPMVVAAVTSYYDSQRAGFASILLLLVVGLVLLIPVQEYPDDEAAPAGG